MMRPIPVICDCDPGHDDAMMLLLCQASPRIRILAVTTSCGNQTIEKTTYNALRVCTLLGIRAPVAKGSPKPLFGQPITAPNIHGQSGLDGPNLPEPAVPLSPLTAVELMAQTLRQSDEPVTILSTGPMTNTAALLLAHPELKPKIAGISLMGGGIAHGNWTPAAEFNVLVDPEAADLVFRSGLPITMAGLDVTLKALITETDIRRIESIGGEVSRVVARWMEFFYAFHKSIGYAGAPLHDAVAAAWLIRPELFVTQQMFVQVETQGDYCRGATIGARPGRTDQSYAPNVRCILDLDRQGFVDLVCEAVASYGGAT